MASDYVIAWNTNSTLNVTMDWGSRITLTYDFNDTNPVYEATYERFYPNEAEHLWNVEGTFYPTVSMRRHLLLHISDWTNGMFVLVLLGHCCEHRRPMGDMDRTCICTV